MTDQSFPLPEIQNKTFEYSISGFGRADAAIVIRQIETALSIVTKNPTFKFDSSVGEALE